MKKRIGRIRLVLAVVMPAAAFVGEYALVASQIPGAIGKVIAACIALCVAIPLAVIVLAVRGGDLPRIGRLILLAGLALVIGALVLPAGSRHSTQNVLIGLLFLLFMALGAAIAYFATSGHALRSDRKSEK